MSSARPTDIEQLFTDHWTGTHEALDTALEAFYSDIRSSVELALQGRLPVTIRHEVLTELDDYVANHYFAAG